MKHRTKRRKRNRGKKEVTTFWGLSCTDGFRMIIQLQLIEMDLVDDY